MSVSQQFNSIINAYNNKILTGGHRQDSKEFQEPLAENIKELITLKGKIFNDLALFSSNESIEDISTKSLKFLSIDYYLAVMCSKKQVYDEDNSLKKNKFKLMFLRKAVQLYMQFLVSLQDYEILDDYLAKKIDSFEKTFEPTLNDLYTEPTSAKDINQAYLKRQQKIEMYRHNKDIEHKLELIESQYGKLKDIDDDDKMATSNGVNEEVYRNLSILKLKSLSYDSFQDLEQLLFEIELLENFTNHPISSITDERAEGKADSKDIRTKSPRDQTEFTDRLETLNKPFLSKTGKVLRSFTLVDKKTELQNQVRGYGQYGPTMSVEEFLEKEFEDGRVLQGGENDIDEEDQGDEDDYKWNEKQTYKDREWDAFKEANPRGSGNTMNRG